MSSKTSDRRAGLEPAERPLKSDDAGDKKLTGNQWQATPQQREFMSHWLNVKNPDTFGNTYQSAILAGYNEHYARQLSAKSVGNKWIQDYANKSNIELEHLMVVLTDMITGTPNSKSPDDTRLKAVEVIAKLKGMVIDRSEVLNKHVSISLDLSQDKQEEEAIDIEE